MEFNCGNVITVSGMKQSLDLLKTSVINNAIEFDTEQLKHTFKLSIKSDGHQSNSITASIKRLYDSIPDKIKDETVPDDPEFTEVYLFEENENSEERYVAKFYTKHMPPLIDVSRLSGFNPDLGFELAFWSESTGVCGYYIFKNGRCLHDEHYENDECHQLVR